LKTTRLATQQLGWSVFASYTWSPWRSSESRELNRSRTASSRRSSWSDARRRMPCPSHTLALAPPRTWLDSGRLYRVTESCKHRAAAPKHLAPGRAPTPTMRAVLRRDDSSSRFLGPVVLPLLSQRHSTALPSPKRYDNRYEDHFLSRREPKPQRCIYNVAKRCMLVSSKSGVDFSWGAHVRASATTFRDPCPPSSHAQQ
jgi:hypothetical protein